MGRLNQWVDLLSSNLDFRHPLEQDPVNGACSKNQSPATRLNIRSSPTRPGCEAVFILGEVMETLWKHQDKHLESFAHVHVNFVSAEKDASMPHKIKTALLDAAAPAQAFPFNSKPGSRYHLVAKVMTTWINEEIVKHISFANSTATIDSPRL